MDELFNFLEIICCCIVLSPEKEELNIYYNNIDKEISRKNN
jgi:hypothetical protein